MNLHRKSIGKKITKASARTLGQEHLLPYPKMSKEINEEEVECPKEI